MPVPLVEAGDLFDHLLRLLDEHGASMPAGWQVRQDELAALAGFPAAGHFRKLRAYLNRAKEHGLLKTTANYTGGGFGTTSRAATSYHLQLTYEQWQKRRPVLVARLEARRTAALSAKSKAGQMERSRKVLAAERILARQLGPAEELPDQDSIAVRVAAMGPDEDLFGW